MSGGASYASKHDLEAREAQWYGGKPGGSTMSSSYGSQGFAGSSPGPKKYGGGGGDGGLTLPPLGKTGKLSESAAMEMEAVRLRMQEQRDATESMIERLMIAHEEARRERESLVMELASMSADSGRKLLIKIITRMCRMQLVVAWQAWHGNTAQFSKMQLQDEAKALKHELKDLVGRIDEAKRDVDLRRQQIADYNFKNASKEQRALLLKIFGRMCGQKSRESFTVWKDAMEEFRRKYTLTLRMLTRLANSHLLGGWKKWYYETFLKSKMTLDETIKTLHYEVGKAKVAYDRAEKHLEKIVGEITKLMIANASPKQKALMIKILTKACTLLTRWGIMKWKKQNNLFKHARKTMGMILSRLMNSELNYGFRKWHMVCIKMTETAGELIVAKLKNQIATLQGHHDASALRIEEMGGNVRKMRESVTLRHSAMSQIAQGAEEVDLEIKLLIAECRGDAKTIAAQARAKADAEAAARGEAPRGGGGGGGGARGGGGPAAAESVDANTRAHLLVFLQNLDHAQPHDTIGALATHPGLPKHKKWLKEYVLLGNQQVAAAIRAYEFTLDTDDFIESLGIIKQQVCP